MILALAAGLTVNLLPGCTRAVIDRGPSNPQKSLRKDTAPPVDPGQSVAADHPHPAIRPDRATIERVYHVENSATRETSPSPASLPDRVESPAELPAAPPPAASAPMARPAEPVEAPLVVALRALVHKHPAEAVEVLKSYDPATQELLLRLLPLAVQLSEGGLGQPSPQILTSALDQVNSMAAALRARAPLTIDKMCFCSGVRYFGDYDPLPESFAGVESRLGRRMHLYVEIRNFSSTTQGEFYVTRLASKLWICDFNKQTVWRGDVPDDLTADRSRTPRTDYFLTYDLCIPDNIPSGNYTLWLEVRDMQGQPGRSGRRSLDFVVTPDGKVRGFRERKPLEEPPGGD
jgi:hypothetical protein